MLFKKTTINGTILLQNKPDAGTALGHCVALGILAIFGLPFILFMLEDNYFTINDLLPILVLFTPIFWFFIVLLIEIYWGFLGIEIVYYSDTVLYIQQKQSFRRDVVIPWSSISHIEPYDEPILYFGLPTHDPTICLHYKTKTAGIHHRANQRTMRSEISFRWTINITDTVYYIKKSLPLFI